jgi:hypothetical protein
MFCQLPDDWGYSTHHTRSTSTAGPGDAFYKDDKRDKNDGVQAGPFLRIFPWGGAFFEKGPFC